MSNFLHLPETKLFLAHFGKHLDFTDCKTQDQFITEFSKIENEGARYNICQAYFAFKRAEMELDRVQKLLKI